MDEILYELREHSAGLNCGRWDYIFNTLKKFRNRPGFTFPGYRTINGTRISGSTKCRSEKSTLVISMTFSRPC